MKALRTGSSSPSMSMSPVSSASALSVFRRRSRRWSRKAVQARTIGSALFSSNATTPSAKKSPSKRARRALRSSFCPSRSSPIHAPRNSWSRSWSAWGAARIFSSSNDSSRMTSKRGATTGRLSFTSTRFIGLEHRGQVPLLQAEHVGLGRLPHAGPHDRAALLVDLEHVLARLGLVEAEHLPEHHHDVRHQVHGVVEHHHPPSALQLQLRGRAAFGARVASVLRHGVSDGKAVAQAFSRTVASTLASDSLRGTLTVSAAPRHLISTMPSFSPLPPTVIRSGI